VAFHKFSENMVPTVCQVTLSVQALYIGFARKNSYISEQLEKQITQDIDNNVADESATKTAKGALLRHTFGKLANMGFAYSGWSNVEIHIDAELPYSLNSWWKAIYDFNTNVYATDPDYYYKIGYTLAQAVDTKSLRFRTDPFFKGLVNNKAAITRVEVTSLNLYFYDADKLPAKWTDSEIIKQSNKGNLTAGNYKDLVSIAKCRVKVLTSSWGQVSTSKDHTKEGLDSLESKEIIKGTFDDPYEKNWITDDMAVYGFDDKRIADNASKYFGDNVKILAQLTLTAYFSGAGGGEVAVPVIKSVVRTLDANEPIASFATFGLDFDFVEVADDTSA
jgi:hypothetical protein